MSHPIMTIPQITAFQKLNCALPQPLAQVIIGEAGSGKSHFCRYNMPAIIAEARGLEIDEVGVVFTQPAIRDSVEFSGVGLPIKRPDNEFVTRFSIPSLIEQIERQRELGAKFVLVIYDELSAADDSVQKTLAPSLDANDRRLADNPLGDDVMVIATGNRAKDKAGSRRLLAHLINRVAICEIARDDESFIEYSRSAGTNPLIVGCAEVNPDWFDDGSPTEDQPFNTYRQATNAGAILDGFIASQTEWDGLIPLAVENMIAQFIGIRAATTLSSYASIVLHDVPTPEDILRDPKTANVPEDTGYQHMAINRALANLSQFDSDAANNLFHYISRCRRDLQVPMAVKLCNLAADKGISLTSDAASKFMVEFAPMLKYAK